MRYTHAFFDLDGTLTNSAPGITHSVQYALRTGGLEAPPEDELYGFIGPPLIRSFCKYFGMTEAEALAAIDRYREYYRARGMLECTLYDGVRALLEMLHSRGVICVLATCKPYHFAEKILAHFELDRYFAFVSGPELDGTRGEKHEVIAHALSHLGVEDASAVLMIGDRADDVKGAARCGMACAGVLWGFGSEAELCEAGAAYICPDAAAVAAIFAD